MTLDLMMTTMSFKQIDLIDWIRVIAHFQNSDLRLAARERWCCAVVYTLKNANVLEPVWEIRGGCFSG